MRQKLIFDDEAKALNALDPTDEDLLPKMAAVFRWKADGSWWCARLANSDRHGQGATPEAAMRAALAAGQPRKRVPLE